MTKNRNMFFIFTILIAFVGLLYYVFHSPLFSNNILIMNIKNVYYLKLLPSFGYANANYKYTILPLSKNSKYGYYTYSLVGKFEKIDFTDNLIYLIGKDKRTYMFRYIIKRDLENPNFILLSYNELNQLHELKINVFESDKTVSPFVKGDDIEIKWESFDLLKNMFFEQHKNILLVDRDGEAVLGSSPQVINKLDIQNYAK